MKKFLLCGFTCLAVAGIANAATLSPAEALERVQNSSMKRMPSLKKQSAMKHLSTVGDLYIFSSGTGYMILPSDDRVPALLGYSESDEFSLDGNPGLNYWLEFYNQELAHLKASNATATEENFITHKQREEIRPLLNTEWNQEWPYNIFCPKVDGHETVTGCVATAMAQVMKYHNYPTHGKGSHFYYWEPGKEELSFDYENTPFEWDKMTDRYDDKSTESAKKAVAELMFGCGISVNMHYEPGGSGAATTLMGEALIDIFDYSPSLWMPNRTFYGYDEWEEMVYNDLAEGLPVLYSGAGTDGGHQFVCDGYSIGGYFHFNWGWGGLSNGYFLLTALDPDDLGVGGGAGGFNTSQIATLGVRPAKDGDKPTYIMYNTENFATDVKEVKAGEDFRASGLYYNYSLATLPEGSHLGMKFEDENKVVKYVDGPSVAGIHLYDGRRDVQISFPELTDGTYTITPALFIEGHWSVVRMPVGHSAKITAVVRNNFATIKDEEQASIIIRDIDLPSVIYREHEFPMPFTAENESDLEFYATVTPWLLDNEGHEVAKSKFRPLDVEAGTAQRITDYAADFKPVANAEFPRGEYTLVFRDESGREVSDLIAVTVDVNDEKTEIEVKDFKIEPTDISDPASVKFTYKVICKSGVYYGKTRVAIFPGDGGYERYSKSSEEFYLSPQEEKAIEVTANLEKLEDGHYQAVVYEGDTMLADGVHFTIDRQQSGISDISSDRPETREVIYGLDGIMLKEPLNPGLYIIDGKITYVK